MKYIVRHVIRSSSAVIKGVNLLWLSSVFPQIVARGDYFFLAPNGGDYSREGD